MLQRLPIFPLMASLITLGCTSVPDPKESIYYQDYSGTLDCKKRLGYTREPLCLPGINFEQEHKFEICRSSIDSFVAEIEQWKSCRLEFLTSLNDQVTNRVQHRLLCLEGRLPEDPPCRLYQEPLALKGQGDYAPPLDKNRHQLLNWQQGCLQTLNGVPRHYAKQCTDTADSYRDRVLQELKSAYKKDVKKAEQLRDDAIKRFNCKAKGKGSCP